MGKRSLYVVNGAVCTCNLGTMPASLIGPGMCRPRYGGPSTAASIRGIHFQSTFGFCNRPSVVAAGKQNQIHCKPIIMGQWTYAASVIGEIQESMAHPGSESIPSLPGYEPAFLNIPSYETHLEVALLADMRLYCARSGTITINDAGQSKVWYEYQMPDKLEAIPPKNLHEAIDMLENRKNDMEDRIDDYQDKIKDVKKRMSDLKDAAEALKKLQELKRRLEEEESELEKERDEAEDAIVDAEAGEAQEEAREENEK